MINEVQLDDAFQARHIAVPMTQAFALAPGLSNTDAAARLQGGRFDQAPVMDDGHILGFVLIRDVERGGTGSVGDVMTPLGSGNVVSADATVGRLLEWIIEPGFLFVLEGREITGFITVSDFNKQPARAYLYLLLARLEIGLAELVRRRFLAADQLEALTLLSDDSSTTVLERYEADQRAGEEGELVAYFDFSDLISVVREDDQLRSWIGGWSRNGWSEQAGGLVDLRNDVMHPVRNIVLAKGGLIQLRRREQRIRELVVEVDQAIKLAE